MDTSRSGPDQDWTPHRIVRVLGGLGSRLVILIPAAMLLGLVAGSLVDLSALSVLVLPLTVLMVYPMMIGFRPSEAFTRTDGRAVGLAMVLNFLVLPLVAWSAALIFFRDNPALFAGMVLAGLFPTSGMTISWTGFAKGNVRAAVKMTVVGLLLASLLAPLYLYVLAGRVVEVDLRSVLSTVLLVIAIPMAAGWATRRTLVSRLGKRGFRRIAPVLPGLSTLGMLGVLIVAMALKAPLIIGHPWLLARIAVPVLLFYAFNYLLAIVLGRTLLNRGDAVAVVYGTVMRNLSIALGVAMTAFGAEAALVLVAAFVVQVQSAAWSVRAVDRVLGSRDVPSQPASDSDSPRHPWAFLAGRQPASRSSNVNR